MKLSSILKNRFVGGMLVMGMLLSSGAMSFADVSEEDVEGTSNSAQLRQENDLKMKFKLRDRCTGHREGDFQKGQNLESMFEELVNAGVISQSDADDIIEYANKMSEERAQERKEEIEEIREMTKEEAKEYIAQKRAEMKPEERKGLLEQMVEDGKMSQKVLDLIRDYKQEKIQDRVKEDLQSLIDDGILSENDIDNLIEYMNEHKGERKQDMEEVKSMTQEERKAYFEEKRESGQKSGIFSEMVEDEILTQEQADAAQKALKPAGNMHKGFEQKREGFRK